MKTRIYAAPAVKGLKISYMPNRFNVTFLTGHMSTKSEKETSVLLRWKYGDIIKRCIIISIKKS